MAETVKQSLVKVVTGEETSAVEKWTGQFAAYDREFSKWDKRVDKILKRYRDEDRPNKSGSAKFNILWSNVQTLIPATFSKIPQADVSRRFKDNDPVGRVASLLLERSLSFEIEHYTDFRETMKACVFDRFLGGRGTAWARYEPHIKASKEDQPEDGDQVTEDTDLPNEELDYECAPVDYVHWRDFGHTVARTWEEVTAVWRKVYMTRDACVERFGEEVGKKIPLDAVPEDLKKGESGGDNSERSRALIYEVWDKETLTAYWICKAMPDVLDEKADPLGLEQFFPCPKPLFATTTNESLVPVPDFTLYQDQARELDVLADRIDGLIQALQIKGVYDDSIGALARIFTEGTNGTLIPVKNWAAFAEKNGLAGAVDLVDLKPIYEALRACYDATQAILKQIYDLTGLSDIVRGESNANETATAQRIKGQYASLRLKSMQMDTAVFASGLIQLKAQIICSKFDPQTILKMAGSDQLSPEDQALIPQAMALLIGTARLEDPEAEDAPNPLRNFRIEVNADTMVNIDEQEEKENRIEFIQAQAAFMEKALPMAQASPQITPLIASIWKFGVQAFKVGKTIEGEFDTVIDQLKKAAALPQQPKPDPAAIQAQAQQATEQMRIQHEQQLDAAKSQREMQGLQFKAQQEQQTRDHDAMLENMRQQHLERLKQMELAQADSQALQNNETKIVVAELASKTSLKTASISANAAQDQEGLTEVDDAGNEQPTSALSGLIEAINANLGQLIQAQTESHQQLVDVISKPKVAVRGPDGRIVGLQ